MILQNFHNSSFSNILSCMKIFLQKHIINQMTSLQTFLWQTSVSEYSNEIHFLETAFAEVRNLELQGCSVSSVRKKRDSFANNFLEVLKFQNTLSFLSTSRMYLQCSSVAGCRLYSCNSKGNSTTYVFLTIFQIFRRSYYKTPS